jgi:plastocyanin
MTNRRRIIVAAGTAAAIASTLAGSALARPEAPQFVQVTEKEWSITLSRTSVAKGKVFVELVNFGTDAHDLVIQSIKKTAKPIAFKQIDPNGRTEKALMLTPGTYRLWCSLPGHRERGMKSTLVVRS